MAGFSVERALGAGFGVIRRKPLALLAWGAVYLVFGLGPSMAAYWRAYPALLAQSLHPETSDPQAMAAAMSGMFAWWPLIYLCSIVTISVLYGAVFRAVLTPEDDRFFYLRLSLREMWLGLTILALGIVCAIGLAVVGVTLVLLGQNAPWFVTLFAVIGSMVGVVWLLLRMSLSIVIAFAEARFVFVDSWALTRGHAVSLLGTSLALIVIIIVIELLLLVPFSLAFGLTGAYQAMATDPEFMAHHVPWLVGSLVIFGLFGAMVHAITGAPWASIYQQLKSDAPPGRPAYSPGEALPVD